MQQVTVSSSGTMSGMFECNMLMSAFVKIQNVRVLSQENGEWSLEIAPNLIAELIAALMNMEQIPARIYICSVFDGVLS